MTSASSKPPALGPLLSTIHSPDDVKKLADEDLPKLAEEIRHTLIDPLSKTGGHLGPNLGVVELTIALHRVFDTPKDKFVFDVAPPGLRPQDAHRPLRPDPHDPPVPGPQRLPACAPRASTTATARATPAPRCRAALGMAVGRDLRGDDEHVVAVAGDAAFTCGPTSRR